MPVVGVCQVQRVNQPCRWSATPCCGMVQPCLPVCDLQGEKIEFHWLPRLGSAYVLQLVTEFGIMLTSIRCQSEGGLDECG
jgi:hypothetical protein